MGASLEMRQVYAILERIAPTNATLLIAGETVPLTFFHLPHYPADADDTPFLLAALNGDASHLVTYDEHLHCVSIFYPEFITCEPLEFLTQLRSTPSPAAGSHNQ